MKSIVSGALRLLVVAVALSMATGCGSGSENAAGADTSAKASGGKSDKGATTKAPAKTSAKASGRTDAIPAGYAPYRCSACGCRVFMGEDPSCSRPSCKHHWSDHQQPTN